MSAPNESGRKVDVLAVMQASADQLWRYRRDILAREEEQAIAAVAELVAADREYDTACGLVQQTEATYGKRSAAAGRARAALALASERRALALAAFGGAA